MTTYDFLSSNYTYFEWLQLYLSAMAPYIKESFLIEAWKHMIWLQWFILLNGGAIRPRCLCIVFDIDGMLFEFCMNFLNI